MSQMILTAAAMAVCAVVMGRVLFWIDGTAFVNRCSRRLMGIIPWDFEEIKSSFIGIWYYILPLTFTAVFCIVFDHNIFSCFIMDPEDLWCIPVTIIGEMGVVTMMSGLLTLFSDKKDWAGEIGNISWIKSIRKRNKSVVFLVPVLGALVEEVFFRGTVFMIIFSEFQSAGSIGAFIVSGLLFTVEQVLFTGNGSQCLSMVFGSIGISFVACASAAYTGSILPCLLAHECFLIFYFGRFRYY